MAPNGVPGGPGGPSHPRTLLTRIKTAAQQSLTLKTDPAPLIGNLVSDLAAMKAGIQAWRDSDPLYGELVDSFEAVVMLLAREVCGGKPTVQPSPVAPLPPADPAAPPAPGPAPGV